jgi:hypothetical protein
MPTRQTAEPARPRTSARSGGLTARIDRAAIGVTLAVAAGAFAGLGLATSTPDVGYAASSVDDYITRSEVLARAQYWVDQGYTYSQEQTAPDSSGRPYRTDCSGLVSMAWHLGTSYVTDPTRGTLNFETWSGKTVIGADQLQPGDAILQRNDPTNLHHIELFASWKDPTDHTRGAWFYSFNHLGETVRNPYAPNNVGKYGEESWSEMTASYATPIRYNKILDEQVEKRVVVVTGASGAMSAFAVRGDGRLYTSWQTSVGSTWSVWTPVGSGGPVLTGTPFVRIYDSGGAMAAFATASDGKVYTSWQTSPGSTWVAWVPIGSGSPTLLSSPTIVTAAGGAMTAFATAADGRLYTSWQTSAGSTWSAWTLVA